MKKLLNHYRISSYYIITLLLSGLLLSLHFIFQKAGDYAVSFPQLAPGLSVILLGGLLSDWSDIKRIKDQFFIKTSFRWLIIVTILAIVFIIPCSILLTKLMIPYIPWKGNTFFYGASLMAMMIGCLGEEIGWRGYLLPRLLKRYTPIGSSVVLGILWGFWHFNFIGGIAGYLLYIITCIEMSIIMTWIYQHTSQNLFLMFLWHVYINLLSHIFLWERFSLRLYILESILFGVICFIIVALERRMFLRKEGGHVIESE